MTTFTPNHWRQRAEKVHFETRAFIQGDYYKSLGQHVFQTENPANSAELAVFSDGDANTVDHAVAIARNAFRQWQHLAPEQRKSLLLNVANQVKVERETLALLDCLEMGMPISMALEQVDDAAEFLRYNAELVDKVYGEVAPADPATTLAISQREPRGVVGVISPWNYPLATAMLAIAPALAAGNTLVIKPSEQTPSSVLKLAEIASQAGLPAGVLNVVPGQGKSTGAALASHSDVDMLHFTGSTETGRQLMVYAGQSNGKPVMLELGGKSPQIVFEDAVDLPNLGANLAQSAFTNTGQLCVAKTRLLVHENIKEQILTSIRKEAQNVFTIGDPLDGQTTLGPIASHRQFEQITSYLKLGQQEHADLQPIITAGVMPPSREAGGYFMQPVLFDNVKNTMRIAQEEIFGPILSVISFNSDDEALQLANDVNYGLAATAWTKDLSRGRRLARDLKAGYIDIRATTTPAAEPLGLSGEPFGNSGFGALGGLRGLDPYTCFKAVQFITD